MSRIWKFFTDGSCINNGKKNSIGGWAMICVDGKYKNIGFMAKLVQYELDPPTNIKAEAEPIIQILILLDACSNDYDTCYIYTDSQFWMDMLTKYMPKWTPLKFKKQKNTEITTKMWDLYNTYKEKIVLVHVPSHNKKNWNNSGCEYKQFCHDYNKLVDEYASKALNLKDDSIVKFSF